MDLTRDITFRGVSLNDASAQVGKPGLIGCSIDHMDISALAIQQYIDKTAQNEGMDFQGVGNLNVASRHVTMRGTLYGQSRGDLWDRLVELRTALDPVQSYADDQTNEGFLPLAWTEPTALGTVNRHINARPEGIHEPINRDRQGTNAKVAGEEDNVALSLLWSCEFRTRDPRVYGLTTTIAVQGAGAGNSGTLTNAGDYPTLVDLTLVCNASSGSVDVLVGGATFTIPVAAGTSGRTIRYRGITKLLTLQDSGLSVYEILRMDMLEFATPNSDTQHPSILPGASAWSVDATGVTLLAGSQIVFTDAYA
jgi:hypothetical protein